MIRNLLLVALGGAVGSVLRYLISSLNTSFPWGTFAVNILGSLLIGLLVGFVSKGVLSPVERHGTLKSSHSWIAV